MIPEVFEKATTHHHFIDMYAEIRYKLKMIGNVKFVDALLAHQEALKVDQLKHMA